MLQLRDEFHAVINVPRTVLSIEEPRVQYDPCKSQLVCIPQSSSDEATPQLHLGGQYCTGKSVYKKSGKAKMFCAWDS